MTGITSFEEKYAFIGPVAVHAAATATESRAVWTAPRACKVTGISISADVSSTGDNTNTTTVSFINTGTDGAGTTAIATLDMATGTDIAANVRKVLTTTATSLAAGSVLDIKFTKVGTGLLIGPLTIVITWYPTA